MGYCSICIPARYGNKNDPGCSTVDLVVDVNHNIVRLMEKGNTILLDLMGAAELEKALREQVHAKPFQLALGEKISEHTGWIHAKDCPAP